MLHIPVSNSVLHPQNSVTGLTFVLACTQSWLTKCHESGVRFLKRSHQILQLFVKNTQNEYKTSSFVSARQHVPSPKHWKHFRRNVVVETKSKKLYASVAAEHIGWIWILRHAKNDSNVSQLISNDSVQDSNSWHTQSGQPLCNLSPLHWCRQQIKPGITNTRQWSAMKQCFRWQCCLTFKGEGKGKVLPRTGHEGPEGEQMYSSTLLSTSALDGVGGQRHAPAALPLGKTRYPLYRRLGGPQGRPGRMRKISPPPGMDPRTVQPVACRYTYCNLCRKKLLWFGSSAVIRTSCFSKSSQAQRVQIQHSCGSSAPQGAILHNRKVMCGNHA